MDIMNSKEAAMAVKSAANALLQNFSITITPVEIVVLNILISYMDIFILKCFKNGKLKHINWITARLTEVHILLQVSKSKEIKTLLRIVDGLEKLILLEKNV